VNGSKVSRNYRDRLRVRAKPRELRMMPVAFGFAAEHFLRKQCFAPQRDESAGVQVFRVQRPQSHSENETNSPRRREPQAAHLAQ